MLALWLPPPMIPVLRPALLLRPVVEQPPRPSPSVLLLLTTAAAAPPPGDQQTVRQSVVHSVTAMEGKGRPMMLTMLLISLAAAVVCCVCEWNGYDVPHSWITAGTVHSSLCSAIGE